MTWQIGGVSDDLSTIRDKTINAWANWYIRDGHKLSHTIFEFVKYNQIEHVD